MLSRSDKDIASKSFAHPFHVNSGTFDGGFHGASSGERVVFKKMGNVVVPSEQHVTKAAQARPATLMDVFKKTVRYGSRSQRHPNPLVRHEEEKLEGALAMDFSPEPTIEDMALMLPGRGVITPKRRIKTRKGGPVPRPATLLMVPVPPADSGLDVMVPPYPVRVVSYWKPVKKVVDIDTRDRKTVISPTAVVEEISIIGDASTTSKVEEKSVSCVQRSHSQTEGGEDPSVETVTAPPVTASDAEGYSFFDASVADESDESILWPNIYPNVKSRWSIATEDMLVEEIQQPKFTEHGSISAMHREILNSFVTARAIFIEMKIGKLDWGIELCGVSSVDIDNATGPESVGSKADRFKDTTLSCACDTASITTPEDVFFPADSEPTTSVESFVSPSFLSLCSGYTTEDEDQSLVDNTVQESFPAPDLSFGPIYDDPSSPPTKYAGESRTKKGLHTALFTEDRLGLSHLSPSKEDFELEVEHPVGAFAFPLLPPPPVSSVYARAPGLRPVLFRTRVNLRETGLLGLANHPQTS